ncbi:hypothetical protein FRC03_001231 [Tulasnella sp. 419]|nr:hypothetical protein FRC03_001231 [Tulasnella sp. 419]
MPPYIVSILLLGIVGLKSTVAKVISVGSEDPRIEVDQYFWLDKETVGCKPAYWTYTPNSTATFSFTGTSLTIIGSISSRGGVSDVYIDSKRQGTMDVYTNSAKPKCGNVLFHIDNLTLQPHLLRMTLKANSTQMQDWDSGIMIFEEIQYEVPDDIDTPAVQGENITGTSNQSKDGKSLGPMIGGIVGGAIGLLLLVFLIGLLFRRKRRRHNGRKYTDLVDDDGEKLETTPSPYMPVSTTDLNRGMSMSMDRLTSSPVLPYRSTSIALTELQPDPYPFDNETGTIAPTVATVNTRPRSVVSNIITSHPPEKTTYTSPTATRTSATSSADPNRASILCDEDVQRIAQAVLAQAQVTAPPPNPELPPAYR